MDGCWRDEKLSLTGKAMQLSCAERSTLPGVFILLRGRFHAVTHQSESLPD